MGDTESAENKEENLATGQFVAVFNAEAAKAAKKPVKYKKLEPEICTDICRVIAQTDRTRVWAMKTRKFGEMLEKDKTYAKFEDRALQCLGHPYITQMFQAFTTKAGLHQVVTEYCQGGDMNQHFKERFLFDNKVRVANEATRPDYDKILTWFTQLLLAMEETHAMELTHRNFDRGHIFLREITECQQQTGVKCKDCVKEGAQKDAHPVADTTLILANYGNTKAQSVSAKTQATMTIGGDLYYLSPENQQAHEEAEKQKEANQEPTEANFVLGKSSDVYALGVFLVELIQGERTGVYAAKKTPFCADDENHIQSACDTHPELANVIRAALTAEKVDRPYCSEIMQMEPVKSKVALVKTPYFEGEFKNLAAKKVNLGWGRACEVERVQKMMREEDVKDPMQLLGHWLENYQERVMKGGKFALDKPKVALHLREDAEKGDWDKEQREKEEAAEAAKGSDEEDDP